jgi:hypothetical protein
MCKAEIMKALETYLNEHVFQSNHKLVVTGLDIDLTVPPTYYVRFESLDKKE